MPVRVADSGRVILNVTVKIEALRVSVVRVGHGNRFGGPIGSHKPAEAAAVVAGTKHVEAGFDVAFFAGEPVMLRHIRAIVADHTAVGIVVDVLLACAAIGVLDYSVRAQVIGKIIVHHVACDIQTRQARASEENIGFLIRSGQAAFEQSFSAKIAPIDGAGRAAQLSHTVAVAVVVVRVAGGRHQPVLGVVLVGRGTVAGHVSRGIVDEAGELVCDLGADLPSPRFIPLLYIHNAPYAIEENARAIRNIRMA